jgi:uncharacterized protein
VQQALCRSETVNHPSLTGVPGNWIRTDEWYNFKDLLEDNQVLITVDESSYSGGTHGGYQPVSWCRNFEGGKVFYTGMGHTSETYSEPLFRQHLKGAIEWLLEK